MAITKSIRAMHPSVGLIPLGGKDLDALRMEQMNSSDSDSNDADNVADNVVESEEEEEVVNEEIVEMENTIINSNNELEAIRKRHSEITAQLVIAEEAKKKATKSKKRKMPKSNTTSTSNSSNVQLQDIANKLELLNSKVSACIEQNKTFEVKLRKLEYLEVNEATSSAAPNNKDIPIPKGKKSMIALITTWLYPNMVNRLESIQGLLEKNNQQDDSSLM